MIKYIQVKNSYKVNWLDDQGSLSVGTMNSSAAKISVLGFMIRKVESV